MLLHHVYRFLWVLLNFVASCCELLHWLLLQLQSTYSRSYDLLSNSSTNNKQYKRDVAFLERCKPALTKIPQHLSVIVGPEELFGADQLMRIAFYALIMEIDCISFYDTRHNMREQTNKPKDELCPPKSVCSTKLHENHWRWSLCNSNGGLSSGKGTNGFTKMHINGAKTNCKETSIEVVMLSAKDGRPLIAEVCRDLFQQRQTASVQNLIKDRQLLMERINFELTQKLHNLRDPDLCIVFNRHTCTFGLLPWQTRFTEFYTIETGRYFNVKTFTKALYKFARCEQRWGK